MERRDFLRRTAPVGLVALAGCSSGSDPTDEPADEPTATDTATASPTATPDADLVIDVGPDGEFVFDPEAADVDVGATVAWVWRSSNHSVTVESTPDDADWSGTGTELHDSGFIHEHTFDVAGVYDYYCDPHRGAEMVGTLTVGDATSTETATDTPTETETATDEPTATAEVDMTVTVAPGGSLRFDPDSFTISAGDTVRWEWDSAGHNLKYDDDAVPDGTSWNGTEGSRTTTYGSDHVHVHTFETTGTYDYYCVPHRGSGMRGSFTVE